MTSQSFIDPLRSYVPPPYQPPLEEVFLSRTLVLGLLGVDKLHLHLRAVAMSKSNLKNEKLSLALMNRP